jgi:hypothetical protein
MPSAREYEEVAAARGWDQPGGGPVAANNPLYVDRNRTRVTIDFEGLLTLREVYEHLASLQTLTDQLVIIDYRKTEDYC